MANTIAIKRRIGSVKNTRQITRAMQLVASQRMRKAQEAAARSRLYSEMAAELLTRLGQLTDTTRHELFIGRPIKARLLIIITSDSGLAGAYNSNVLRAYLDEVKRNQAEDVAVHTICIGQKAAHFVAKLKGVQVKGAYKHLPETLTVHHLQPVLSEAVRLYKDGVVDAVEVIYTHFYSAIRQEPHVTHLLPAGFSEAPVSADLRLASFEPSVEVVLDLTTQRLLEAQLFQALLEAVASEQSMRMLAMKSATDNATDIVDDLTLAFNNARQAGITQELAEITGGTEAMNG